MNTIDSITRTVTVANVVENLRKRIILQEYNSGIMLTELKLSQEYETSRGTIRTALQTLEAEGLIETLENGRKKAVTVSGKYLSDLYETRKVLECEAVRLILKKDYVNFAPLYEAVNVFNKMTEEDDPTVLREERYKANDVFHMALLEATGNKSLVQCWNTIQPVIQTLAKINSDTLDLKTNSSDYVKSHTKILQLLITRDTGAVQELERHIELAKQDSFRGLRMKGCVL